MNITDEKINQTQTEVEGSKPKEIIESLGRGKGSLVARCYKSYSTFYFRYTVNNRRKYILIGRYSHQFNSNHFTVMKAHQECAQYIAQLERGENPAEQIEIEAGLKKKRALAIKQGVGTFGRLLTDYENTLRESSKHKSDVRKTIKRHIRDGLPDALKKPANQIEWDDLQPAFAKLLEEGKGPMANMLLSYLKTAFNRALNVTLGNQHSISIKSVYELSVNPIAHIKADHSQNNPGKIDWTQKQIALVWRHAQRTNGPCVAGFIRFIVATAGQRHEQVVRVPWSDYYLDSDNPYMVIENMKRKRGGKATPHLVPLNKYALKVIKEMKAITGHCKYPFAKRSKSGKMSEDEPLDVTGMSNAMAGICKSACVDRVTLGAIRGTAKTLLGEARIPKLVRDLVCGHGTSDVSTKHYDKYDHFGEKLEALDKWASILDGMFNKYAPEMKLSD